MRKVLVLRLKINLFYDSFFSIISARLLEFFPSKKAIVAKNILHFFLKFFPTVE